MPKFKWIHEEHYSPGVVFETEKNRLLGIAKARQRDTLNSPNDIEKRLDYGLALLAYATEAKDGKMLEFANRLIEETKNAIETGVEISEDPNP